MFAIIIVQGANRRKNQKENARYEEKRIKRKTNSKHKVFENQDHSVTAQIYFEPVHMRRKTEPGKTWMTALQKKRQSFPMKKES